MLSNELRQAIEVWCSTYPRRVTSIQVEVHDADQVEYELNRIYDDNIDPYISVYGFPSGHTTDKNVPTMDTLFIDFDIPKGGEYRSSNPDPQAWYRDMSELLTRVRSVARLLVRKGSAPNFRASLSGHKGVHLYLDFHPIDPTEGTLGQFKAGTKKYATDLIDYIEQETLLDLETWVDVDSSDMSRLCRMPNTKHWGATRAFNEDRYCVPVSVRELAEITPNEYAKLTRAPREVPDECTRNPSDTAGEIITQYIRNSAASKRSYDDIGSYDPTLITKYEKKANDKIELEDVPFLTTNKPCVWAFRERNDMFNHGSSSHDMELNVIGCLLDHKVPIDVIVEFFSSADNFDPDYTEEKVKYLIARNYDGFNCETVWERADEFCLGDSCAIYRDEFQTNEQKPIQQ